MLPFECRSDLRSYICNVRIGVRQRLQNIILGNTILLDDVQQFFVLLHLRGEERLKCIRPMKIAAGCLSTLTHRVILLPLHENELGDVVVLNPPSEIIHERLTLLLHRFDLLVQQSQTSEFRLVCFVYERNNAEDEHGTANAYRRFP